MKIILGAVLLLLGTGGAVAITFPPNWVSGIGIFLGKILFIGELLVGIYQATLFAAGFVILVAIPAGLIILMVGLQESA